MTEHFVPIPAPEVHETHISTVFLVGDRAAKLKKPVAFPFLDLSTREARERSCHREVELNRRLCPDVYLGVFDLVGPDGSPCDHLVMMRRMPAARRLSFLIRTGKLSPADLQDLTHVIAGFHERAESSDAIDVAGTRDRVAGRWESGFAEIARHLDPVLHPLEQEIEARARRYLAGREPIFAARIADGRIRDGHGDLLADDVFMLEDGPRILDCLEFDDDLRYGDVLADVAFLAMDIERLGATEDAGHLLAFHREYSADSYPASLCDQYLAMRAHIRAKVEAIRAGQGVLASGETCCDLLVITAEHLRRTRVSLVLVGGAPGTGKSTLAQGIARAGDFVVLRSDEVRKDLAGLGHLDHAPAALDRGIYSDDHTRATYAELLGRARALLEVGESVVLDASWADAEYRTAAQELARAAVADLVEIRCEVDEATATRRILDRARRSSDPSDVTPEIGSEINRRFDRWPSAVAVMTSGSAEDSVRDAQAAIRDADPIDRCDAFASQPRAYSSIGTFSPTDRSAASLP